MDNREGRYPRETNELEREIYLKDIDYYGKIANNKNFNFNVRNPLFSRFILLGGINKKKVSPIEILSKINIPTRSSIVPRTTNLTTSVEQVAVERLPASVLEKIEEAISKTTSNYDTLENELEQGVIV